MVDFNVWGSDASKRGYTGEYADSSIDKNKPTDYNPVKPYDPLDLDRAKKNLSVYEEKIDGMAKQVESLQVNSDRSMAVCTDMIGQAAALSKKIDSNRKGIVEDAYNFYKKITSFGNVYVKKLDAIVAAGKKKIGAYQYEKEMQRRESEAKARAEQGRLQKEMDARAKKAGVAPVQVPDIVVPQSTGPVRTESGTASVSMVWTWEVEDVKKVPREYLIVGANLVDNALKSGIRKIPGIKIYEKPQVRVRSA